MNNKSIIIIGAGASGLISSIMLARARIKVILLEQNSKIGKKILTSGNGKCNISNRYISTKNFHSQNPKFIKDILDGYSFDRVEEFFNSIGLALIEGKDGKIFPMSLQASSVVEVLEYEAKRLKVNIVCNCRVNSISKENNIFIVKSQKEEYRAKNLLLTSGSLAHPQLGGSDSGYNFASSMGHTIISINPSLVQLCSDEKWLKEVSGTKVLGVAKLYANGKYITEKRGDLLFTNYGISGLAILDLSREVSIRLAEYHYCELTLDLMPSFSREQLTNFLLKRVDRNSHKSILLWLQGVINKKLINIIIKQSKSKAVREGELNRKEIIKLVYIIKNLKLPITETRGFKGAEVASGGVDTTEINPKNMQSKIVSNLYFAGEILDVDGDRGGFNFHFAWVSGMRVKC